MTALRHGLVCGLVLGVFASGCARHETSETTFSSDTLPAGGVTLDGGAGDRPATESGVALDSSRLGAQGDSSADVVATSATLAGLRAQILEHRDRLDAAVRRTDFAAVEREALTVRDLIVALTGRARSNLDAQQTVALEQFMHDVSENAEKLRLAARERSAEAIIPLHRELGGLVDQVLKLTTG